MKHKYGIGLFVFSFVMIYLFSYTMCDNSNVNNTETKVEESVSTDGQVLKKDCFYLHEINGYVVVFLSDQKTPYEYTNILYSDLPELLQLEIKNGKYIESMEELYGFLENYSS